LCCCEIIWSSFCSVVACSIIVTVSQSHSHGLLVYSRSPDTKLTNFSCHSYTVIVRELIGKCSIIPPGSAQ
jgi:hypothetical protein